MTLTELRYIVTLAQERHFGRAAERCFVSQPTLSIAVKKLETELDVALFERHKSSVTLTPTGQQVVDQAQKVLDQAHQVNELAKAGRDPLTSPLRLGAIYTVAPYLFPHLVPRLRQSAPTMPLYLEEGFTEALRLKLRQGDLDAIIIALPFKEADVVVRSLYDEDFVVLLPAEHDWSQRQQIAASELDQIPLLMLGEGNCFRDQVLEACSSLQAAHKNGLVSEGGSLETIRQMVASGLGSTVLPQSAIDNQRLSPLSTVVPFSQPIPQRTLALAWRASFTRPKAIDALLDAIGQCPLAQLSAPTNESEPSAKASSCTKPAAVKNQSSKLSP